MSILVKFLIIWTCIFLGLHYMSTIVVAYLQRIVKQPYFLKGQCFTLLISFYYCLCLCGSILFLVLFLILQLFFYSCL
jgi:hypothetical protein